MIMHGKVALISGGAEGIGAAVARQFTAAGGAVMLADVQTDKTAALATELGAQAAHISLDVRDPAQWDAAVRAAQARFGKLTHLFNIAAGAGGHAGTLSPFAFMQELREWFDGPIALSGAIASGRSILAAQAMGADFAYIGSPWIATVEANADQAYKEGIAEGRAADIVYSSLFTGVHGNYLRGSILRAGLDPDNLPEGDVTKMNFGSGGNTKAKAWKDIWGSGQGIGAVTAIETVADRVDRLEAEYHTAIAELETRKRKGWR